METREKAKVGFNIIQADNLEFIHQQYVVGNKYNLVYIDPPYNSDTVQSLNGNSYSDRYAGIREYMQEIEIRLRSVLLVLEDNGSFFIQLDHHAVHYVKIALDGIFGIDCFMNEIIWAYDYGARQKDRWPTKHDSILWYVKDKNNYTFNYDQIDRIPYMAPGLVGKEKAEAGKTPTDVWWNTIVPTQGTERVGYPTQKPLAILERIVKVHSNKGDNCLDFYAGSGSFGEACLKNLRNVDLVDNNPQAIEVMKARLEKYTKEKAGLMTGLLYK